MTFKAFCLSQEEFDQVPNLLDDPHWRKQTDPEIHELLYYLNNLNGVKTAWSCQGHEDFSPQEEGEDFYVRCLVTEEGCDSIVKLMDKLIEKDKQRSTNSVCIPGVINVKQTCQAWFRLEFCFTVPVCFDYTVPAIDIRSDNIGFDDYLHAIIKEVVAELS